MSQPLTSINQYARQEESTGKHQNQIKNENKPNNSNTLYHQLHTNITFKPSHPSHGNGNTQFSLSLDKCETSYLSEQPQPNDFSHLNLLMSDEKNSVKPLNSILKKEQPVVQFNQEEKQHLVSADSPSSTDVNRSNLTNLSSTFECAKRNNQNCAVER